MRQIELPLVTARDTRNRDLIDENVRPARHRNYPLVLIFPIRDRPPVMLVDRRRITEPFHLAGRAVAHDDALSVDVLLLLAFVALAASSLVYPRARSTNACALSSSGIVLYGE